MLSSIKGTYQVKKSNISYFIDSRWFNSNLSDSTSFIMIVNEKRRYTAIPLSYMNNLRTENVYTSIIRGQVSKKIKYRITISIAKISIQIAIMENVISELIRILTQFIMKYYRSISLSIDTSNNIIFFLDTKGNKSIESQGPSI